MSKDDPKYAKWKAENMLVKSWIYNSIEGNISLSFRYCKTTKEICDSIASSYAQRRNHARSYMLTRDLAK